MVDRESSLRYQAPLPVDPNMIVNQWIDERKSEKIVRIEMLHRDECCEDATDCDGELSVHFEKNSHGFREVTCPKCGQSVKVSTIALRVLHKLEL